MATMIVDVQYSHCPFHRRFNPGWGYLDGWQEWIAPIAFDPNESHWLIPTWEVFYRVSE